MTESILVTNGPFKKIIIFDGLDFSLETIIGEGTTEVSEKGSVFGFVLSGPVSLDLGSFQCELKEKMYFSTKTPLKLNLRPKSKMIVIKVRSYLCLNTIGGPVEAQGRLRYIDGCSDTLLLPPSRQGEPCLNLLHFPINTDQTEHHHPSFRFGIVIDGEGESHSQDTVTKLKAGDCFFIPAMVKHKFRTHNSSMNVIAFHPDSDWGPTDEVHPMINRTIIN